MKVIDLRRKLAATLAACGMLGPGAAYAANLNTNLAVNPGFENVDLATTGNYNGPKILDWTTSGGLNGFAYAHQGGGGQGADYANGRPLAGGGQYYFSANNARTATNTGADFLAPGQFYQDINVAGGPSGTLISSGQAAYNLSAFFSSYLAQNDRGIVQIDFRDAASTSLGTATLTDSDTSTWGQDFTGGSIPSATQSVRLSVYGIAFSGGPDGYVDNIGFQVTNDVVQQFLAITVDRDTGGITLANRTGAAVNLSAYSITSAFEGLTPASWRSIADNYDAGNPGPNQVDAAHQWTKLTDPATHTDLSEADLDAGPSTGASLANNRIVNLSTAGGWIKTPREDLVFSYISAGVVKTGIVAYAGHGSQPFANGDLNTDGVINAADWMILRVNQHTNMTSLSLAQAYRLGDLTSDKTSNHADFAAFKTAYETVNGVGSFAALLATVPEPSAAVLLVGVGVALLPAARRSERRSS